MRNHLPRAGWWEECAHVCRSGSGDFMRTGGLTSAVHTSKDIDQTLAALEPALSEMKAEGII